jgi:hypothetical protein
MPSTRASIPIEVGMARSLWTSGPFGPMTVPTALSSPAWGPPTWGRFAHEI